MIDPQPSPPPPAAAAGAPHTDDPVAAWRRATRERLLTRREALAFAARQRAARLIGALLEVHLPELDAGPVALYWPYRGEPDLRDLADVHDGEEPRDWALPVVVSRAAPLEFRRWWPGTRLERGVWGIPVPAERDVVVPSTIVAPLLGFDAAGYRLGYGGGYYDRTLAALSPRPLVVGVGYAFAELESIRPQAHDVPMDLIVTEDGVRDLRGCRRDAAPAS